MGRFPIRNATLADVGPIAALCRQLGYPDSQAWEHKRLGSLLGNDDHAVHIARAPGGRVVGWAHIHARELLAADRHGEIGGNVVGEDTRNQGVRGCLIRAAEHWARNHGCSTVYVQSNALRQAARAFYPARGYIEIKEKRVHRKDLDSQD